VFIAVSGGGTPREMFAQLADPEGEAFGIMPWSKVRLFFVDERLVPPDVPDSNYNMVRETLLSRAPIAPEYVFRIKGEHVPRIAAFTYSNIVRNRLGLRRGEIPSFDIVQLGMGDDGHTASIFPHTAAVSKQAGIAIANYVPQKDAWRVTLTYPVINNAAEVFFLISGKAKAEALRSVLHDQYDPVRLPAQLVRPQNGRLLFLLDQDAAELLPELPPEQEKGTGSASERGKL